MLRSAIDTLVISLIAATACRDEPADLLDPPPVEPFSSGSRLLAHRFEADGGARQLIDFFDSQLSTNCSFAVAEDGKMRCLPSGASVVFADDRCTTSALVNYFCEVPEWGGVSIEVPRYCGVSGSGVPVAMFRRGRSLGMGKTYGFGADGGCEEQSMGERYLAEPVPAETFVAIREEVRLERGSTLSERQLIAEDGASMVIGLWDEAAGIACGTSPIGPPDPGEIRRCLPVGSHEVFPYFYDDAACSHAVAYADETCPSPPLLFASDAPDGCNFEVKYYQPGRDVDPSEVRVGYPMCGAFQGEGKRFTAPGEVVPADSLTGYRLEPVGTGRVKVFDAATLDGRRTAWRLPGFVDSERNVPCSVQEASDGTKYCIPIDTPHSREGNGMFEDPECTKPVVDYRAACGSTGPPSVGTRAMFSGSACIAEPLLGAFELGEAVPLREIYSYYLECMGPFPVEESATYHRIGPARDLSAFAIIVEK